METTDYEVASAGRLSPIRVMAERGAVVTVNISIQRHGFVEMVRDASESKHNNFPNWIAASFVFFIVAGAFAFVNADVHADQVDRQEGSLNRGYERIQEPRWIIDYDNL